MFRHALLTAVALSVLNIPASAEETFPAKLAGHAYLPALTLVTPPADAPQDAWVARQSPIWRNGVLTSTASSTAPATSTTAPSSIARRRTGTSRSI